MNREQLLKRWNELAPGECEVRPNSVDLIFSAFHSFSMNPEATMTDRAVLLSALIKAIRARGWHSVIWNDDEAFAHVKKADSELLGKAVSYEPCDALLSAYVQALEDANK